MRENVSKIGDPKTTKNHDQFGWGTKKFEGEKLLSCSHDILEYYVWECQPHVYRRFAHQLLGSKQVDDVEQERLPIFSILQPVHILLECKSIFSKYAQVNHTHQTQIDSIPAAWLSTSGVSLATSELDR